MTKDEALDLALKFVEANHFGGQDAFELITAIKQARSAPVQEPDWSHAWLLIKAASYASSQGHISGTTNWGAAMSAYLRHESKAAAQPAPVPENFIDALKFDVAMRDAASAQEPVAIVSGYYGGQCVILPVNPSRIFNSGTAFYTTPPAAQRQWVGLTDDEFENIELGCRSTSSGKIEAMQKVEAKLKEKNGGVV